MNSSYDSVMKALLCIIGWMAACAGLLYPAVSSSPERTPLPSGFVYLEEVDPTIEEDIRYFGSRNFLGRPVEGYEAGRCILTEQAAMALAAVQRDLKTEGLSLKVYDCYRPQTAVDDFAVWVKDGHDQRMKPIFYPNEAKHTLFEKGYIAARSGHSKGSTVDLTLISLGRADEGETMMPEQLGSDCTQPALYPFKDNSLDMGTAFDCFDPLSQTLSPFVSAQATANRLRLKHVMEKHGFTNLPEEWWHYTLQAEPFSDRYFDFPVK